MLSRSGFVLLLVVIAASAVRPVEARRRAAAAPATESREVEIGTRDGVAMRRFLHDLVAASGRPPAEQGAAMRKVFADHPKIVQWAVEGRDFDRLMIEAGLGPFQGAVTGGQPLRAYVDQTIARMAAGPVTRLDGGLGALVQSVVGRSSPLGLAQQLPRAAGVPQKDVVSALADGVDRVPDGAWQDLARDIDASVAGFRLTQTDAVQMLNDPANRIELPDLPPKQAARMQTMIRDYFDHIAVQDKRAMLLATLALPPSATMTEQLGAVLHSAGPVAQKLFQLLGRNAKSPLVREVMNELKSQVRPFPDAEARAIVERKLGVKVAKVFDGFERVGSATTGQVYRARLRSTGQVVAIKVIRPGIREKAEREIAALRTMVKTPFEIEMVEILSRKVREELDLVIEGRNIDRGQVYARTHSAIAPPERVRQFPATDDVLVTTFIEGGVGLDKPIDESDVEHAGQALVRRGRALVGVARTVVEEGLTSGLVHADLHGGNLLLVSRPDGDVVAPIDWGSVVDLSLAERRGFAALAMGAATRSSRQVIAALHEITPLTRTQRTALQRKIRPLLRGQDGLDARIINLLAAAIDREVRIPEGVTGFARTLSFLLGQVADVNLALDRVDPDGRLARFRAVEAAGWAGSRVGTRDVALGLLNRVSVFGHAPGRVLPGVEKAGMVDVASMSQVVWNLMLDGPAVAGELGSDAGGMAKRIVKRALPKKPSWVRLPGGRRGR